MRSRFGLLAGALTLGLASTIAVAQTDGQNNRPARAPGGVLSLINGVTISPECGQHASSVEHIAFSTTASHKFLGYGVSIEPSKAAANIQGTITILKKLGFAWVKVPLAEADSAPGVSNDATQAALEADLRARLTAALPEPHKRLFEALHAAGIKVVDVIHRPPPDYFDTAAMTKSGKEGRRVKQGEIPQMAQYYAAYLRALLGLGIHPDLVELINEPNLGRAGKFKPAMYAQFLKALETNLAERPLDVNLSAPATASARVPVALRFLDAMQAQDALAPLKAITLHTYYVRDQRNDEPPPADEPAFKTIAAEAMKLGVPMISTEFGGTDVKTKLTDPGKESVDGAEEFKAALDLIRNGESAAIVWTLYPNHREGETENTWALIDANGPTNAYWLFYVLSREIPVGSDVLAVKRTDVSPAMDSLGYAAFRSGRHVYVGLSNPAPPRAAASVVLDISDLGRHGLVHAAAPLANRAVESEAEFTPGTCPLNVTLPSGTSALLDIDELQ